MDIILLPLINQKDSPANALKILRKALRSVGVLVGSPPLGLVISKSIRKAKNLGAEDMTNVERQPIALIADGEFEVAYNTLKLPPHLYGQIRGHLTQTFPGMPHREFLVPAPDLATFENLLPAGFSHGFLGYDRGAAVVITRHETLAREAAGPPPDCACKNPADPHEYFAGQKKGGDSCDVCGAVIDCG